MKRNVLTGLLFLLLCNPCVLFASGNERFEITQAGVTPKEINIAESGKATVFFKVSRDSDVILRIYDQLATEIRRLDLPECKQGRHEIVWDGRDAKGNPASDDVVLYVLEAQTADGLKTVYNPSANSGGIETKPLEYTFDRTSGKIEYVLPKACKVRIRAGLKDGMFFNTILDWVPQSGGRHTLIWDGKDSSGILSGMKRRDMELFLTCFTLPDNTILTEGKKQESIIQLPVAPRMPARESLWGTKGKYQHYQHDPRICHQPRFSVSFPSTKSSPEKIPLISGVVPVRVEINKNDFIQLINSRFEVMLFVDGTFIHEIEEGTSPFTYQLDTKNFLPGRHVLTGVVISYNDHIGVLSSEILVEEHKQ